MKGHKMKRLITWWSGGIASAVTCKLVLNEYRDKFKVEVVFIDTMNEHQDTYRFLEDCEKVYNQEIKVIKNEKYGSIEEVWRKHKSLNVARGAICSSELKKNVRVKYQDLENDFAQAFGFDYDKREQNRAKNMLKNYPEINPIFPLIENKITKSKCIEIVGSWGVAVPEMYILGFRNNNCFKTGCIQGGIGYWQKMEREYPEKFNYMANIEHELSLLKGKPVTICKDQSGGVKNLLFLKKSKDFPEVGCIGEKIGRDVEPLSECNGFCSTDQIDLFDNIIDEIKDNIK